MALHTRILLGLLIGAVLGIIANQMVGPENPVVAFVNEYIAGPVGQVFFNLLYMIVMPLVFASISLGVAGLGDLKKAGRVGIRALGYFVISTALAASAGLILVGIIKPGTRVSAATRDGLMDAYSGDAAQRVAQSESVTFGIDTFVNIVTRNPVASAVNNDMLGVIFFGIMFGVALTMIRGDRATVMVRWLEALNDIVIKIVEIAMRLAPYGVAGLIFGVMSRFGFDLLVPIGRYIVTVMGGLLAHGLITIPIIVWLTVRVRPWDFYKRVRASLVTAFSTSSSAATLPTNIAVAERSLGVPPRIAGFVLPLGATMCMNGTAIFEGITVIFLAQVFGVTLDVGQQAVVMVMCVLTAVGAAGVPGGSIPLLVGILAMFGVPGEAIGIVLGVDRILDMSRTTLNVVGDLGASLYVAKNEAGWTLADLPDDAGRIVPAQLDETPDWSPGEEFADVQRAELESESTVE